MKILNSSTVYDETVLLQLVAKGDEVAFGQLMQQHANFLATHIFHLTHHREQTEEIVQDVFLKIWQTREALTEIRNFRTYLYVISRNQAMNAIRSMIRERKKIREWQNHADQLPDNETIAEREHQYSLLEKAIGQVPAQQQQAWLLSRRQGLKYKEIAREMGIAEETVKKYIQYASQSILRYMDEHMAVVLLGLLAVNA